MKKTILILFGNLLFVSAFCQTLTPDVIATSGDYFTETNGSITWTLGEIATQTYSSGGNILTQGFQQPIGVTVQGVDILVFLEGPFSGNQMNTALNSEDQIPVSQPYNTDPWNYSGTETADPIPSNDVVDWVLIELRDAKNASSATPETVMARQAALLLNDGSVVGVDGSSIIQFNNTLQHKLFIVVWHRNHIGIISADPISQTAGIHSYDFSTAITQVYNGYDGYKEVGTNVYGMVGGDADANGNIDIGDKTLWSNNAGDKGYKSADYNMDTQVNNQDKDDVWVQNTDFESQVPE